MFCSFMTMNSKILIVYAFIEIPVIFIFCIFKIIVCIISPIT